MTKYRAVKRKYFEKYNYCLQFLDETSPRRLYITWRWPFFVIAGPVWRYVTFNPSSKDSCPVDILHTVNTQRSMGVQDSDEKIGHCRDFMHRWPDIEDAFKYYTDLRESFRKLALYYSPEEIDL